MRFTSTIFAAACLGLASISDHSGVEAVSVTAGLEQLPASGAADYDDQLLAQTSKSGQMKTAVETWFKYTARELAYGRDITDEEKEAQWGNPEQDICRGAYFQKAIMDSEDMFSKTYLKLKKARNAYTEDDEKAGLVITDF